MSLPALLGEAAGRHDDVAWARHALELIQNDQRRSADTHLLRLDLPALDEIVIYLKDESTHPTGSLKHRLARSLFLYGICNGRIRHDTPVVEASSGSTAISEAYFARMLALPFHAVMSASTSPQKIQEIERQHGTCHLVADGKGIYAAAEELATHLGGVYLDQFTYAERATDWRGNNNIAESIFEQMSRESHPVPAWIVMSAGTGGTTATIGRYIRYKRLATRLCVADAEYSAFFEAYATGNMAATCDRPSRIEGI
jgi:cysteine synthase A